MKKTKQVKLISKMPYKLRKPLTSDFLPRIWPGFLYTEFYNGLLQPKRMPDHITGFPLESFEGSVEQGHALIFGEMIAGGYVHPFHSMKTLGEQKDIPLSWLESVHRFDWLRDLQAVNTSQANKIASRFMDEWFHLFKNYDELAWRLDICASRLLNIYSSWKYVNEHISTAFRLRIRASLCRQATFLERRLHTVEHEAKIHALCAILWSSIHLPDWRNRYKPAMTILFGELEKQIFADGGHISRSPMRAFQIFHDIVNLSLNLSYNHIPIPTLLDDIIQLMATFIRSMRHNDKRFALFHGTHLCDGSLIDTILVRSQTKMRTHNLMPQSGYARLQCGPAIVIMDTGKKTLKEFKTEVHCSPMAFEFSHGIQRILSNAGAEIAPITTQSKYRHMAFRSSAAHCMATFGRHNSHIQQDFQKPPVFQNQETGQKVMAAHEGWKHLGWLHQRSLALSSFGNELLGQDLFIADEQKKLQMDSPIYIRFLLAPGILAEKHEQEHAVSLYLPDESKWFFSVDHGEVSIGQGIWQGEINNEKDTESVIVTLPCTQKKIIVNWRFFCIEEDIMEEEMFYHEQDYDEESYSSQHDNSSSYNEPYTEAYDDDFDSYDGHHGDDDETLHNLDHKD